MTAVTRICPKCQKPFKGAGFNGHLRFVHKMPEEEISAFVASMKPLAENEVPRWGQDPLVAGVDELLTARRRRKEFEGEYTSLLIPDAWVAKTLSILKALEEEAQARLKTLVMKK